MNNQKHKCKIGDLVFGKKPIEEASEGTIAIPATCRICGKVYDYSKNDGLWDPGKKEYVFLPI